MKAMDLPQRHGEHREDFGLERVHPRGDRKYAQSSEGTGDRGATWRRWFWRLDTGGWRLDTRKCRGTPTPGVFVRADSKGLAGALSVRADSKGLICTKIVQNRAVPVRAESKGVSGGGTWRVCSR